MDSAPTIEVKGATYQIGKLSPKKAFHVSRRLAPFLGAILPHLDKLFTKENDPEQGSFMDRTTEVLPKIAEIAASMPNDDVDYIIDTCLSVVHLRQERGWAPVSVNGTMMFENIDMMGMLQLTAEVVRHNLTDFFPMSLPTGSAGMPMRMQ